jgi:Raf kinase inhibitor-like YbhB/YbcL family protein
MARSLAHGVHLRWSDPPANTAASARELPEGVAPRDTVAGVGTQGLNDFWKVGHGGPCPPKGPAHRYFLRLYALDMELALPTWRTNADVVKTIEGHVLGQAELMGRYKRR